jgi:glycine cleavage system aminomethyltransferase T
VLGTAIYVEIRGQKYKAGVVATPFYKRAKKSDAASGSSSARAT